METIDYHEIVRQWLRGFFFEYGAWLAFAVALILADLRFGIMAARKRGEQIRGSRMRRRTMNKIFDYSVWLFVAYACNHSLDNVVGSVISVALVLYVYLNELASALNNYADYKGLNRRIDIWKLIIGRHDIERALEDASTHSSDHNKSDTDDAGKSRD